jgi:hypothetical protein
MESSSSGMCTGIDTDMDMDVDMMMHTHILQLA